MAWSEAKWTVDKLVQLLGIAPKNLELFDVTPKTDTSVLIGWQAPSDSIDANGNLLAEIAGVMIRYSTQSYPKTVADGELAIDSKQLKGYQEYILGGLQANTKYYFTAFTYAKNGATNTQLKNIAEVVTQSAETINCKINIGHKSGFVKDILMCTYPSKISDETVKIIKPITKDTEQVTFTVPANMQYSIRQGEPIVHRLSNDDEPIQYVCTNTLQATASAGYTRNVTMNFKRWEGTIEVDTDAKAKVTVSNGGYQLQDTVDTDKKTFRVHSPYGWTVKAEKETEAKEAQVNSNYFTSGVAKVKLDFTKIYGIKRDFTKESPLWTRTDNATNLRVQLPFMAIKGYSDFDKCYPWSKMQTKAMTKNGKSVDMVYIPKFWYKRQRQGNFETIQIASSAITGFTLHPGSGCWLSSKNYAHDSAETKNDVAGWSDLTIDIGSALQMLMLVEYATNDYPRLLTKAKTATGYRGIVFPQDVTVKNVEIDEKKHYACNNIKVNGIIIDRNLKDEQVDKTGSAYGSDKNYYRNYTKDVTFDSRCPHIMQPAETGDSDSTYYCYYYHYYCFFSFSSSYYYYYYYSGSSWFVECDNDKRESGMYHKLVFIDKEV